MSNEIILYDLPSKGRSACWSLNPWKARLALNYKGVPYKTEWVEYPDLAPKFKALGIPPNSPETNPNAEYSSPAIKLPDGRYIMDSLAAARELEQLQPSPSLHIHGNDYANRTQEAVGQIMKGLAPIAMPRIPERLLNPSSAEYFHTTREKRFGMPLSELAQSDKAGERAWSTAEPGFGAVKALLVENGNGPYIQGGEPSFADFVLAGFWRFMERLDTGGDLYGRIMEIDPVFARHREACQPWLDRDD
ncbi:related to glutathione S-transferase [Lecanosticta acicola]|uniref:Related to glutathione S-transferase n=1 Tax=Lecanosticta acicola TaxID=111012 RepID=A0AAI8YWH1_9PEZI|nr:related to glutathione S-transferase [Lecanosticta acicola]